MATGRFGVARGSCPARIGNSHTRQSRVLRGEGKQPARDGAACYENKSRDAKPTGLKLEKGSRQKQAA